MQNWAKAMGKGMKDGGLHFTEHERSHQRWQASKATLASQHVSVLTKARVASAVALYMARKASPIGLAENTYYSFRQGLESYNEVRTDQYAEAIEAVVGQIDPGSQQAIRRAFGNPAMPPQSNLVVGNMAHQRFTNFQLGTERT